jgi:hypothetical protein
MLTMSMRAQPVRIMISKAYILKMVDKHSFAAVCTRIIVLQDCLPIESCITARNLMTINI